MALEGGVKTIQLRSAFAGGLEAVVGGAVASGSFEAGGAEDMGAASMGISTMASGVGFLAAGGVVAVASDLRFNGRDDEDLSGGESSGCPTGCTEATGGTEPGLL